MGVLDRLPAGAMSTEPVTASQIFSSVMGLRFASGIRLEWEFIPSIGIIAEDIDRLGIDIRSFKEPLKRSIKQVMIPSIEQNFMVGGRPAWEPLAEATVQMRGSATPILVRSGKLMSRATQLNIWTIDQTTASIRSLPQDAWYGVVHQAGYGGFASVQKRAIAKVGSRKVAGAKAFEQAINKELGSARTQAKIRIPARPFAVFQSEDEADIQDVFSEWIAERATRVGRFGVA